MLEPILERKYASYLAQADVTLNGAAPRDPRVHDKRLYRRVLLHGTLGLGEAYMDGWWDAEALDEFFTAMLAYRTRGGGTPTAITDVAAWLWTALFNLQSVSRAFQIGKKHYDRGNALFEVMLDSYMNYSCGYWKDADNLEDAQRAKMRLICDKLMLRPGMKVLDVGCGWGGTAKYMAENYGVSVTGVTVSEEQAHYARRLCRDLPVEILLMDYRLVPDQRERFDRIYSVGMFEHVGYKNYKTYMRTMNRLLKDDGLFLLHTIGSHHTTTITDAWIAKYIFPNSMLPSVTQIARACDGLFVIEDWHNFGTNYDKTLMAWFRNFNAHWPDLKTDYDERFYRLWKYYLMVCAGSFRSRRNQLWQVVMSPYGVSSGYRAPR